MHSTAGSHDWPTAAAVPFPTTARVGSDPAVTALRGALQALLGDYARGKDIRRAIRLMCLEARRRHLKAEHLVVLIKQAWNSLPEMRRPAYAEGREQLLGSIVTMCIEEYYAGGRSD